MTSDEFFNGFVQYKKDQ